MQATPEKIAQLNKRLHESAERAGEQTAALAVALKELDGKRVEMSARANSQGHLYKGITKKDIIGRLGDTASSLDPEMIVNFAGTIKEIGEHVIHIAAAGIEAAVTIAVHLP